MKIRHSIIVMIMEPMWTTTPTPMMRLILLAILITELVYISAHLLCLVILLLGSVLRNVSILTMKIILITAVTDALYNANNATTQSFVLLALKTITCIQEDVFNPALHSLLSPMLTRTESAGLLSSVQLGTLPSTVLNPV